MTAHAVVSRVDKASRIAHFVRTATSASEAAVLSLGEVLVKVRMQFSVLPQVGMIVVQQSLVGKIDIEQPV